MKYNEQNIKQLFKTEKSIWKEDDLDWFDQELVSKLQNNQLLHEEKQKLINMMANDQMVMNRYLKLKQQTNNKVSWFQGLFQSKTGALLATGLALVMIVSVTIFSQYDDVSLQQDLTRGTSTVSVIPANKSVLEFPPEYFVIQNNQTDELQIKILSNNTTLWSSPFLNSNKFHFPLPIRQKMGSGQYIWKVYNRQGEIKTSHEFSIL